MSIKKRPGTTLWWLDIAVPEGLRAVHGERIRRSSGTSDKKLAQQLHDKIKSDLWKQAELGERPAYTLRDAITRWEKYAATKGLRQPHQIIFRLNWWAERLGDDRLLRSITRKEIMAAVEGKLTVPKNETEQPRPATPATINHYLKAIRGLLMLASGEWEMIDSAPKLTLLEEPKGRVRTLPMDQVRRLLAELPEWWRPVFTFALATGLRKSNVLHLRWDQIDLERRRLLVGSDDFKNGEHFGLPINDTALAALEGQKGEHEEFVFTRDGEPMRDLEHRTWRKALARAGIENFRWHDLRHVFSTMYLEAGGSLDDLQKLGGWKSRDMVLRYAHYHTDHLRGAAAKIDGALSGLLLDGAGRVQ